jgi:hypothetical protein
MTQSVDMFSDLVDEQTSDVTESSDNVGADAPDAPTDTPQSTPETEDKPVETVPSIPQGAVSVTEFAQWITQELIKAKMLAGEELDGTEYTVPQAVYQTVKAQRDRIPHVLVRAEGETEARVYIQKDEAFIWWMARREKLKDRGAGAKAASNRTPEDNLTLLGQAVQKALYAQSRQKMWNERVDQTAKLVEKYRNFLSDASVGSDTIELAIQEATDAFNAEQAQKAEEKAAKAKKNAQTETTNTDTEN